MIFTLDLGPRIISYTVDGGANALYEDTDRRFKNDDPFMAETFGKDSIWYIYGGHRLWISPELDTTYYPDNDPVTYAVDGSTVTLTSPVQRVTNLQFSMAVTFAEGGKVDVLHTIHNRGNTAMTFAPWAITVLDGVGGTEIIPFNESRSPLLPNRYVTLWPYSDMQDSRVCWGTEFLTLRNDPSIAAPIKIGLDNRRGGAVYLNHGQMFIKRFDYVDGKNYPDNGCNFETYTVDAFLEMETLGPTESVAPGSAVTHSETWQLVPDVQFDAFTDETAMKALIEQYL